ncbi:MAG: hypothetical protein ABI671_14165 [Burkholderiales bacterium]
MIAKKDGSRQYYVQPTWTPELQEAVFDHWDTIEHNEPTRFIFLKGGPHYEDKSYTGYELQTVAGEARKLNYIVPVEPDQLRRPDAYDDVGDDGGTYHYTVAGIALMNAIDAILRE